MDVFRTTRLPWGFLLTTLLVALLVLLMAIPKTWEEATKIADDDAVTLADDWAGTIERKAQKYEKHDLYMLVAARNGYFQCRHCPTGKFFLKKGELFRYGTTGNDKDGRGYYDPWLSRNVLSYVHLLTADLTTVKIAETNYIGAYALYPENLDRPVFGSENARTYWYRLVIPPGNNRLD